MFGISTVIFCSIVCYYSWKFQKEGNYKIAVLLLMLCGLALRIYTATDFFLHPWDERYHALVAKNLIQHPMIPTLYDKTILPYTYQNWTASHIWLHKQPLPLWAMAFSMWLFGVNEIALRLPSILLTTIGIGITFYIASYLFDKKVGYLAAFFYAINGLIIELAAGRVATDHVDIFFLFFVELAVFFSIIFAQRQKMIYNILVGLSMGAAILSKWLPALIVLPIWLLIMLHTGKFKQKQVLFQLFVIIATSVLVALPWQLYIFNTYPTEANWEASFNFRHITEVLEGSSGPIYYFIDKIRINYGELIYQPLLWFVWTAFRDFSNKNRLAVLIWFLVPFLFFSSIATKMQAYILFACPALFMMTAEFWYMLSAYNATRKSKWFFNLILFLLIALPIRYTIERTKPFEQIDRKPAWVKELKVLNDQNIKNGVLFNYDRPIEAMFYTNLTVYPDMPDKELIVNLVAKGYTVFINDDEHILLETKKMNGVIIRKFLTTQDH